MKLPHFSNIYKIGLRFPVAVLLISFLLTGVALYFAKNLKIETDFSALLPPDTESVQNLNYLKEKFGSRGYLYSTVEAEDPKLAEEFADRFVELMEQLPTIRYVDYRRPVQYFDHRKWLFLDEEDLLEMEKRVDRSLELQKEGVSPVFSHLMDFADEEDRPDLTFQDIQDKYDEELGSTDEEYTSGEGGGFIILRAKAKQDFEDFDANRALVASIRQLENRLKSEKKFQSVQIGYAGSYLTSIEGVDLIQREMAWVSAVVFILLLLILIIYFRRFSGAVLIGLPLLIGVLWTGGVVYFILGHVNIITAFAVSILAGLGSDYGIYLLSRFSKERDRGVGFVEACHRAFGITGKATFAAMVTTIGAFGALIFSGFDVFVEFGIVGAIGLFLNYLAMMLVMPSLLRVSDLQAPDSLWSGIIGWKNKKRIQSPGSTPRVLKIFSTRYAGIVISLTIILCGFAALSLPTQSEIHFEDGQMDFEKLPSNKLYDRITETVGTSLHPSILVVQGAESERRIVKKLNQQLDDDEDKSLVFEKVFGISSFIPENQDKKRSDLKRLGRKYKKAIYVNKDQKRKFLKSLEDLFASEPVSEGGLPSEVKRMFVSPKGEDIYAVYVFPAIERGSSEEMEVYNRGILQAKQDAGVDFVPVDTSFVSMDLINMISREAPKGLILILVFFTGVLFLSIRNVRRSLLILANLLGGIVLLSGTLFLVGIKLNILNIAVFPIILGTGIDCFIHFSHRYNETGDLRDAIRNEVPAILISNLTSIVGFGGLLFTSGVGLRSIGWVSVIGLVVITLLCVFIFPRCLSIPALGKINVLKVGNKTAEV